MNNIQNQPMDAELSHRQTALSDAQFESYVQRQSISASKRLDAGLTIKTREGDLVTLTSSSHSQFDAVMYNSKGVLVTTSGTAAITQNLREITLSSGESFSFSVEGDLSREELEDIENIVKGIDEIVSEMVQGDMDGAVSKALSMGGYDTISMYSADISYQRSYSMTSESQAETVNNFPEGLPADKTFESPLKEFFPDYYTPDAKKNSSDRKMNRFVEKMTEILADHEKELLDNARKPIDKLFKHHLNNVKHPAEKEVSSFETIENARQQLERIMDRMEKQIVKDHLSVV